MDSLDPWIKGFVIGFSIAAPVGPIGMLCIQRTLAYGRLTGLLSGLGAASADLLYGLISGLSLTALSAVLISGQMWLQGVGILFLTYLGVRTLFSQPTGDSQAPPPISKWRAYLTTFGLTLTNPISILAFTGIMAGAGITAGDGWGWVLAFVAGVFCGSATWWFVLSLGVSIFRSRLDAAKIVWVNRFSGIFILIFGVVMAVNLIQAL